MRAGTGGYDADELVELGVKALFFAEPIPEQLGMLGFMTDTGISVDDLRQVFGLPNEFAEAVVRLVVETASSVAAARAGSPRCRLALAPASAGALRSSGMTRGRT